VRREKQIAHCGGSRGVFVPAVGVVSVFTLYPSRASVTSSRPSQRTPVTCRAVDIEDFRFAGIGTAAAAAACASPAAWSHVDASPVGSKQRLTVQTSPPTDEPRMINLPYMSDPFSECCHQPYETADALKGTATAVL
jgi:hypothetical protein